MLEIDRLNVYYGGSHILRDVTMRIPTHGVTCLMGRNGAGKTTLLKSLIGLVPARRGSVVLSGEEITSKPAYQRARQGIAYVPQGREILAGLTVAQNLQLGLTARQSPANGAMEECFGLFPALKGMLKRRGGDLSGGEQQQLAIARALLSGPRLLLLDEPTEGIQPSIIDLIEEAILRIKQSGKIGVLLVEQYLEFAMRLADRSYIMEKGAVVAEGSIAELNEEALRQHLTL